MIRLYPEKPQSKHFTNQNGSEESLQAADGSGQLFTVQSGVAQQFLKANVEKRLLLTKTLRGINW